MTGPPVTRAGGSRGFSDNLGLDKDEAGEESKIGITCSLTWAQTPG